MFSVVTHEKDDFAVEALDKFKKRGYPVNVLTDGEYAQPSDLAIFSVNGNGIQINFPGRHSRLAAHRLIEAGVVPEWALSTPYLIAIRKHPNQKTWQTFDSTVKFIGQMYEQWFAGIRNCNCPWGCEPTGDSLSFFTEWQKMNMSVIAGSVSDKVRQFFTYLEPLNTECLRKAVERVDGNLRAVSAFCFHSDKSREGIVDSNPLIEGAVAELIDFLPIERLDVFTFHPDDIPVLEKYNLQDVILSELWGDRSAFEKQWQASERIVQLTSKVNLLPLKDLFQDEKQVEEAIRIAKARAGIMAKVIAKDPPPIFQMLSKKEQKKRLAAEAVLYLLMTARFPEYVYIGFEVHAEYWRTGELFKWGKNYLPILFTPKCLRQHWGDWNVDEARIAEVRKLALA